ncbi:MAG: hypothetical protein ABIJ61_11010 [bacterium]
MVPPAVENDFVVTACGFRDEYGELIDEQAQDFQETINEPRTADGFTALPDRDFILAAHLKDSVASQLGYQVNQTLTSLAYVSDTSYVELVIMRWKWLSYDYYAVYLVEHVNRLHKHLGDPNDNELYWSTDTTCIWIELPRTANEGYFYTQLAPSIEPENIAVLAKAQPEAGPEMRRYVYSELLLTNLPGLSERIWSNPWTHPWGRCVVIGTIASSIAGALLCIVSGPGWPGCTLMGVGVSYMGAMLGCAYLWFTGQL